MGSLQERAVSLINLPPSARAARDIEMVLPWLQKRSQLLMELDRDTLKDIMRHCSYEKAATDDVIIQQGERGDKFYVIMTGRASVYIVTKADEEPPDFGDMVSPTPSKAKVAKQIQEVAEVSPEEENGERVPPEGLDRSTYGKFIMHYEPGTSFGEIALLSPDAIRNASIIADMDTDLLVIDRALFNRSVKAKEEAAYKERYDFVQHHTLFSSWTAKLRRLLEMSLRKETHPFGSVIMRQGQPAHGLVFILSGQAKVCMEPGRHETQFPSVMKPPPDPLTTANKKPPVRDRSRAPRTQKTHAQIEVRRQQGYAAAEKRLKGRSVDLCCVERNEIIGDTEMVLELDTNMSTVVSTATTEIFVLNAKNYDRLVTKKNPATVRQLLSQLCQKLSARLHSAKVSQLPIIPRLHATATEQQRRLSGSDASPAFRTHDKGGKRERPGMEKSLARMFLQGRVPLIKPFVPDALFYRESSISKMNSFMNSPYAKLRTLTMLNTYTAMRRKAPRSIQQLRGNVKAERELLGHQEMLLQNRQDVLEQDDDVSPAKRHLPRRPASAAPGFQSTRVSPRPFTSARPRSAMDMRIVPCQDEGSSQWGHSGAAGGYGFGTGMGTGEEEDQDDTLDEYTVSEIFHQMDAVQRDKNDSRVQVLCTNTARSELRVKLESEPAWSETSKSSHDYEELYEDAFYDWETSDGNLRDLEERIASFCSRPPKHNPQRPNSSKPRPSVAQLKRFEVEDSDSIPLPGGTVFVHHKPCRYSLIPSNKPYHHHSVTAASSPHSHVRRFMLQRDT